MEELEPPEHFLFWGLIFYVFHRVILQGPGGSLRNKQNVGELEMFGFHVGVLVVGPVVRNGRQPWSALLRCCPGDVQFPCQNRHFCQKPQSLVFPCLPCVSSGFGFPGIARQPPVGSSRPSTVDFPVLAEKLDICVFLKSVASVDELGGPNLLGAPF